MSDLEIGVFGGNPPFMSEKLEQPDKPVLYPVPPLSEEFVKQLAKPKRKIIQIAVSSCEDEEDVIYALCNDGTVFAHYGIKWNKLEPIPQD